EVLYDTEEQAERVTRRQLPGDRRLPPRTSLRRQVGTGEHAARRGLDKLYDWLDLWSLRPMRRLGALRHRFGDSFVKVAARVQDMRLRLSERLGRRERRMRGDKSWGGIAVRALWAAVRDIGQGVLSRTFALVADSLASGLRQRIRTLLPFDDAARLREQVEQELPWIDAAQSQVEGLVSAVQTRVDELGGWLDGILGPIERV